MLFLWGPLDFRTWTIFIDWLLYILETTNDELGDELLEEMDQCSW